MEICIDDYIIRRFYNYDLYCSDFTVDLDADYDAVCDIELTIYNKEDIKTILKCADEKALNFLKFMYQTKYAIKIGREYYVKREDFVKFLDDYMGKTVAV